MTAPPDAPAAADPYLRHAAGYDASARRTMGLRRRTVARLRLRPGDRVLDVACGTGLSFPLLQAGVGPGGRIVGVELSPAMIELARQRCQQAGWGNVSLLQSAMEGAELTGEFDALLFNYTHDVLRSPAALANIFAAARPGARVALAGMKFAPPWLAPLNFIVRAQARPYMASFDGLHRPWSLVAEYLEQFAWRATLFGTGYIGWGIVRGR